jgi:peptidoglycan/LPS O-acetylase OafA/YrhL
MRLGDAHPLAGGMMLSREIRSLNTVRGVAALMVAVYHAPLVFGVSRTLPHAYLAVDLFFVLSGFVISHAYHGRIVEGLGLSRFTQLRLARLYPLLFLATLAGFGLWGVKAALGHVAFHVQALVGLPLNLMLLPAHPAASADGAAFPFIAQSWSIVWEVALCGVYFLWVRWSGRGAWALAVAGAVALGVAAARQGTVDGGWTTQTFAVGGLRAMSAFWAGVCVYQVLKSGFTLGRLQALAAWTLAAAVLAYVLLVHRTWWAVDFACVVIGFPAIIAAAALSRHWLLENRLGDWLGQASFSVYLLHGLTIDSLAIVLKVLPPLHIAVHAGLGAAWIVALVAGCWVCWKWVETPLRVRFSREAGGGDQPAAAVRVAA